MTTPSRRSVLAGAAAAAIPTAALTLPAQSVPDPMLAVLDQHRKGWVEWCKALDEQNTLEKLLPHDLRQSNRYGGELTIVETDDPRWLTHLRNYDRAWDIFDKACLAMTNVMPTTMAGILALLVHIDQYNRGEFLWSEWSFSEHDHWPDDLTGEDDGTTTRRGDPLEMPWAFWVMRNVQAALQALAVRS